MSPLAIQPEPFPIAEMGATVLLVGVLLVLGWLLYFYR